MTKPTFPPALLNFYLHANLPSSDQIPGPFDPARLVSSEGVTASSYPYWGASLEGTAGADLIVATSEQCVLLGLGGDDILLGGPQANLLDGGEGRNFMMGGQGNDTYTVNSANDVIVEFLDEGIESVYTYVGYTLPDNVENLACLYSVRFDDLNLVGNDLNNYIVGASRTSDTILGLGGNDILNGNSGYSVVDGGSGDDFMIQGRGQAIGGAGADTFVAAAAIGNISPDPVYLSIADFSAAEGDRIIIYARQSYDSADLFASGALSFDAATHRLTLDFDPSTSSAYQVIDLPGVDSFDPASVAVVEHWF